MHWRKTDWCVTVYQSAIFLPHFPSIGQSTSTRVAGGTPTDPLQESIPRQSPVWHAGLALDSKLHPVRPQKRPFHLGGALTCFTCPDWRRNPPSANTGFPEFGAIAGHMGKEHLFLMWNVTIWASTTAPVIRIYIWPY